MENFFDDDFSSDFNTKSVFNPQYMFDRTINLETAKLAKEKGFNVPTLAWFFSNFMAGLDYIKVNYIGPGQFGDVTKPEDHNNAEYYLKRYSAPTLTILQEWLMKAHNIYVIIEMDYTMEPKFVHTISVFKEEDFSYDKTNYSDLFRTYHDALEDGLFEALKKIS